MKSLKSKALMALFLFVVSLVLSCWLGCGVVFAEKVGLKIQEVDGSPAVWATNLTLPNGTVSCTGSTCTYTPAGGSGDVTGVGDCASGACLDGSSDGGTYISLYDGTSSFMKMLAGVRTLTLSSGVASSEDLTITLGSNDNTVGVSSSTGVTTVDFGSIGLKAGTLVVGTVGLTDVAGVLTSDKPISAPSISTTPIDPASYADHAYTGDTETGTAGATITRGQVLYLKKNGGAMKWYPYDGNDATIKTFDPGGVAVADITSGETGSILTSGTMRDDTWSVTATNDTADLSIYPSGTAGGLAKTKLTGSGDVITIIGRIVADNTIRFNFNVNRVTVP